MPISNAIRSSLYARLIRRRLMRSRKLTEFDAISEIRLPTQETLLTDSITVCTLPTEPSEIDEVDAHPDALDRYLFSLENTPEDVDRLPHLLGKPCVLLEIGCGCGEAAWQIALKNPDIGVVATDLFDCGLPMVCASGYRKVAEAWRARRLPAQQAAPDNLLVLRADLALLRLLPDRAVDTLLLINAEPAVGKAFVDSLVQQGLCSRLRPGPRQVVILPYCREMGITACGGYEFEHAADWSRGLGYVMDGRMQFRRGGRAQWGVDLYRASPYSGNSTQSDVFIYGEGPVAEGGPCRPRGRRLFFRSAAWREKPRS